MSGNYLGKKMVEEEQLLQFLEAYEVVTGVELRVLSRGERPDFVCAHPNGETVGVELSRSSHDYEMRTFDRIWSDRILASHDLFDGIFGTIRLKSTKLLSADWRTPKTILVVQSMDYAFDSFAWAKDPTLSDECAEFGFEEIWIADYSTLEPNGQLRLVGLYPRDYFGLHCQPALERKPYG
jgi:hypothetical protein